MKIAVFAMVVALLGIFSGVMTYAIRNDTTTPTKGKYSNTLI